MPVIDMEVQDVEFAGSSADFLHMRTMCGVGRRIGSSLRHVWRKATDAQGYGIGAREKRHVMALLDERSREYDTIRSVPPYPRGGTDSTRGATFATSSTGSKIAVSQIPPPASNVFYLVNEQHADWLHYLIHSAAAAVVRCCERTTFRDNRVRFPTFAALSSICGDVRGIGVASTFGRCFRVEKDYPRPTGASARGRHHRSLGCGSAGRALSDILGACARSGYQRGWL